MLPGKKSTESVSSVPRQHGGAQSKDLNWAWDTIGKVRSEIRRMEHRLDDSDLRLPPPASDLRPVETGRELDQTYTVRDQLVGAAAAAKVSCDRYDYSAYQRSKTAPPGGRRKVSRLDEKYSEESDPLTRLGSRKSDRDARPRGRDGYQRHDYHSSRDVRMGSPKRVDFSRSLHLREVNNDGTYLDSIAQHESSSSSAQSPDIQSTLTDSRAIRETDVRILNDHIPSARNYQDVRWDVPQFTRVNVQVPGVSRDGVRTRTTERLPNNFDGDINVNAGVVDRGRDDFGKSRRVKKTLKDLPSDSELFAKLKEKIRQQRLSASSSDTSQDSVLSFQHGADDNPQHVIHSTNDVVSTKPPGDGTTERNPRVRKVAAGPPVPVYRGFAEVHEDPRFQNAVRQQSRSPVPRKKPKKVVGKLQRKTASDQHSEASAIDKPKKSRVVAQDGDTTKSGAKGIITTSSWRAGQELILQTLGPARSTGKKSSQSKKSDHPNTSDDGKHEDVRRPDGAETHNLMSTGNREGAVGGNSVSKATKSLSDEARRVLDDLHLEPGGDHERRARPERCRAAVKRKAPKHTEPEKMQPSLSKHRHYDQNKVRKYIAKQKAERLRQKREEEKLQRSEKEKRQKHLEDLYIKQKPKEQPVASAPRGKSRGKKGGEDDQKHEPGYHMGDTRLLGVDYNKENVPGLQEMDVEDDDSTLTEGTEDDVTPTGTPRDRRDDFHSSRPPAPAPISSTLSVGGQKLNLDVAAVLSKFHEVVSRRKETSAPVGATYQQPRLESSHRTRAERIKAVKETSMSLQNKLALLEGKGTDRSPVPRYDRIVGSQNEYRVFDSSLPGSLDSRVVLGARDQNAAATRIQAAYRGHTVRQSMNWPLPSGQTLGTRYRSGEIIGDIDALDESSVTETSTFSDITITEDSENESMNSPPGKMLKHMRGLGRENQPTAVFQPTSRYQWEEPRGDPLSIINVYQRKMKNLGRESDKLTQVPSLPRESAMITQELRQSANQGAGSKTSTNQRASSRQSTNQISSRSSAHQQQTSTASNKAVLSSANRGETLPKSRDLTERTASSRPDDISHRSQISEHAHLDSRHSRPDSSSFRPVRESVTDDSCTHSVSDEDDDRTPTASRPTPRALISRHSGKGSEVAGLESDASLVSDDDMLQSRLSRHDLPPRQEESREPGRFSPNTLERKMFAELNRLESMEETLHQLTSVDRTRAVSMAQQETVSLAQMLKARQQNHEHEMRQLKLQAQKEAYEANRQLEETTRQRGGAFMSAGAAGPTEAVQQPRMSQEELTRLKKEAIRQTAEAWNLGPSNENRRPTRKERSNVSESSKSRGTGQRSDTSDVTDSVRRSRKPGSTSYSGSKSYGRSSRSVLSGSVQTAKDSHDTDSDSIRTVSDAEGRDTTHGRSIQEDIHDEDYTMSFDESMTEDESFRQVLPSESHRKEVKRRHGDPSASLAAADETGTGSRLAIGDLTSLFVGEDNFSRFTAEMVRQIMREEELRAQHQAALLRLREKALKEKTKAELAWIKQQKQLRQHGGDDKYPQILKQEQSILKRQKEQQDEIRRLQEANKLASRERQSLLQQHEEIAKMRQSTIKTLGQLKELRPLPSGRLNRPDDVHTEDEVSALEDASDASEDQTQSKDYKSDSEVYGSGSRRKVKGEKQKIDKQMKNRLDQKYLTSREQKLHNRRRNAEELLAWRQRLDEEEQEVFTLEKKALSVWGDDRGAVGGGGKQDRPPTRRGRQRTQQQEDTPKKGTSKDAGAARRDETTVSEQLTTARDESVSRHHGGSYVPKSDAISTQISVTHTDRTQKRSRSERTRSPTASGSEGSIPEEIPIRSDEGSASSPEKNDDTIVNSSAADDYNNDTFEHDTTVTSRKKSPVGRFLPQGSSPLPSPWSRKGGSESESEDSISHTETLSDASDYEVRIRQLSDELRRRRKEAEILKKDRKRKAKEKMRAQEDSLKKQIEAYDNYINQLRNDQMDLEHDAKATVKPQIKQPKVTTGKSPRSKQDLSPTKRSQDGEHNQSSSFEEIRDGTESSQTSPSLSDSRDQKLSPVPDDKSPKKKQPFLDRISEGSESDKSGSSAKREKQKVNGRDRSESSVSEAIEEISHVEDGVVLERTQSGVLQIQTGAPTATDKASLLEDDPSYSMTFTEPVSISQDNSKLPLSVHSRVDRSEQGAVTRDRSEVSVSEQIEEALSLRSEQSASVPLVLDLHKDVPDGSKPSEKSYTTGIPESDSENETKSHHTLSYSTTKSEGTASRPSSEKSVASTNYSQDFEEEEDVSESERTPVPPLPSVPPPSLPSIKSSGKTEDEVSEHISASLPSISEKKSYQRQDSFDNALLEDVLGGFDEKEDEEEEKTPTETPRGESPPLIGQEENSSLLLTDPLADFTLGDRVVVWGRKRGKLSYKGKVDFAPGIWAGVELDKAEGDMDGTSGGRQYFSCPPRHGVLVHGSDISPLAELEEDLPKDVKSPDDSITDVSAATETDLEKEILSAAENVESFTSDAAQATVNKKPRDINTLADDITDHLAASIVRDSVETMGKIAARQTTPEKTPPPTMPKPKVQQHTVTAIIETVPQDKSASMEEKPASPKEVKAEKTTDSVMDRMLDEAITQMVSIRNKQRSRGEAVREDKQSALVNGHVTVDELDSLSGLDKASGGRTSGDKGADILVLHSEPDVIQRPESPLPGEPGLDELDQDISGLLGMEDNEYFDDDMGLGKMGRPPPPYPGGDQAQGGEVVAAPPQPEEVVFVVPHQREEVESIVASAIDVYWNCRRCGEPLDNVEPPDDYFRSPENGRDMESRSKRVFKRLLFDLTGEIVREIYKDENDVEPPPWQKAKRKQKKYYKGLSPPSTVDRLCPIVQSAVSEIMGLNGARNSGRRVNKWNIRKKRDHVDNVLVQELQEEEPTWVNYDSDELSVKMQLTDTILESLLADTVLTFNEIFQKRHYRAQQS